MHDEPPATASLGGIPPEAFVIIIGAMKCGTTSLFRYLCGHPQLCPSRFKEPEFFSEKQSHKRTDITRYASLWNFDSQKHRYVFEASTGYTKYPLEQGVPARMHAYGLRPKFIYIVRNPFDRIVSEHEFRSIRPNPAPPSPTDDPLMLDMSKYYLQLQQFRRFFDRDAFLVLDFDALRRNPLGLVEQVCRFLDVDPRLASWDFGIHNKTPRPTRLQARLNATRVFGLLPRTARRKACRALGRWSSPSLPRRVLTGEEREVIYNALRDDMLRFGEEYGVDVGAWGFR